MGRVTIKRKSTLIDMTAMSDVTVLLLTFFMLTSTFLQKEPVTVVTPSSVSDQAVPANNLVTTLVDTEGHVYLSITGAKSMSSDTVRMKVLHKAVAKYDKLHNTNIAGQITEEMMVKFGALNLFGCKIADLPKFLNLSPTDQDLALKPGDVPFEGIVPGIPIDGSKQFETRPNEYQIWMTAYYDLAKDIPCEVEKSDGSIDKNGNVRDLVRQGKVIAVKADASTAYSVVSVVMDNLRTMKMNKFTLMTSLKQKGN